jgi:cytochrome b6-f complex iron-sulfur subunit
MNRKEFIKTCGVTCAGAAAFSVLLQSCATSNYTAQTTESNNQIAIKRSEFTATTNGETTPRKFVLVRTDKFNFPIAVYKLDEENYSALLMECTHRGCELQPQGDYLMCPCHGSEFSNRGVVQSPPAEENLRTFQIKTDHENVYVLL